MPTFCALRNCTGPLGNTTFLSLSENLKAGAPGAALMRMSKVAGVATSDGNEMDVAAATEEAVEEEEAEEEEEGNDDARANARPAPAPGQAVWTNTQGKPDLVKVDLTSACSNSAAAGISSLWPITQENLSTRACILPQKMGV